MSWGSSRGGSKSRVRLCRCGDPQCASSHRSPSSCTVFPEAESNQARVTLPAGACQDPQGHSSAWALLLTSRNPGLASAGRPARLPLYGACQETMLPTTSFSGQREPFGVRGLRCEAKTIKIKIARTPRQPGPGSRLSQRGAPAELVRKHGGGRWWGCQRHEPAPLPDLCLAMATAPSSHVIATETSSQGPSDLPGTCS